MSETPTACRHTASGHRPIVENASILASILLALAVWIPAFATTVFAQSAADPSDATFGDVIDVRVVNLEVVVDRDGERVRGLGPDDFELLVDGRVVPIEYFTEVSGGVSVAPREGNEGGNGAVPALEPGKAVGTSFLVFVDDFFTLDEDRDRVLDGLIEQLPNLQPWDRMAIVAFDGERLELLSTWTSSQRELRRALQKAKLRPTKGLERRVRNRSFETERDAAELGLPYDTSRFDNDASYATFVAGYETRLSLEEEQYARLIFAQTDRAVRAATATLRSLAGPPGRKAMLLLSGGWPSDPAYWTSGDTLRSSRSDRISRGLSLLSPLVETANLLGYTVYPVDVPGVGAAPNDVDEITPTLASGSRFIAFEREREEEAALYQIARETGGKAIVNTGRTQAFEAVVADTRSYYWLGFTPSWKEDDSAHRTEVRLKAKSDADIRTRRSYSDLSRGTEVTMMVESALLIGDPPSAAPLAVRISPGKRAGFGKRMIPLAVAIPLGQLTFLPGAEGYVAQAELRLAVLDAEGATTEVPVVPLRLDAPKQPGPREMTLFETEFKIRNERHDLVVSLYDRVSGKILSAKLEIPAR